MLLKLLKYDFRRALRFFIPIIISSVILGVGMIINSLILGNMILQADEIYIYVILFLFFGINFFTLFLSACSTMILIFNFVSYYRSMFTGRGYFTLSVPVKSSQILISKLITAFVTCISVFAVMVFSMIISYGSLINIIDSYVIKEFYSLIKEYVLLLVLSVISGFASTVFSIMYLYFLPLFGYSIAKKRKTLGSILWTIGGVYGLGIIEYAVVFFASIIATVVYAANPTLDFTPFLYGALILELLVIGGLCVALWFVSRRLLSEKHEIQ